MDIIDEAQRTDREFQEKAIRDHRIIRGRALDLQPVTAGGRRICADCEEEIPKARIAANPDAVRCVECQAKHEGK